MGAIELTDAPRQKRMAKAGLEGRMQREASSGLILPKELITRTREVLTRDNWKHLQRAIDEVLEPQHLKFMFLCGHDGCPDPRVQRRRNPDGGFRLRCGCRDRVFMPNV